MEDRRPLRYRRLRARAVHLHRTSAVSHL